MKCEVIKSYLVFGKLMIWGFVDMGGPPQKHHTLLPFKCEAFGVPDPFGPQKADGLHDEHAL